MSFPTVSQDAGLDYLFQDQWWLVPLSDRKNQSESLMDETSPQEIHLFCIRVLF
jgi:hypothetical protein